MFHRLMIKVDFFSIALLGGGKFPRDGNSWKISLGVDIPAAALTYKARQMPIDMSPPTSLHFDH